jgi:hypothetical protein
MTCFSQGVASRGIEMVDGTAVEYVMIDFCCEKCGRQHRVKDEFAGKRGKCPCGNVIAVPEFVAQMPVAVPASETAPIIKEVVTVEEVVDADEVPEVVAVHATDEPLYIYREEHVNKFRSYCERCKLVHQQSACPGCGYDHTRGVRSGCMYCNTDYRSSRKNCPLCKVEINLDKARNSSKPEKALAYWQAAYDEARAKGYDFHFSDHLSHVHHLVEASHFADAWRKLNRLVIYLGERLSSSVRDVRCYQKYAEDLSHVEEGIALHNSREAKAYRERHGEDNAGLCGGAVTHAVLSLLYYRISLKYNQQLMPDIYRDIRPEHLERTNFNRLKRVLIDIKKNKKGRPEQLCEVVARHLATVPKVDAGAVQQDVMAVLTQWA